MQFDLEIMGNKLTHRRPAIDDCHTRPQGLYPCQDVDQKKLRRLILDSKLAPCYPGREEPAVELEECPICFLHYPSLNRSKCCSKGICTECFLQMKSPNVTRSTGCPYCKMVNYSIEYRGPKSMEEKGVEQAEEQKVIEAKIRMRQKELQDDEERKQHHDDDDQDYHPPPPLVPSLPGLLRPPQDSWRTARESISHPPRVPLSSGLSERSAPAVEPDLLWVRGSQRSEVDDESARAHQQAMPALVSNPLASAGWPTPRLPPGVQLTSRAPNVGFSHHQRDDEFDLGLEDIMVMEAIWLSIQEQGDQHIYTDDDELDIAALPRSLSTLMTNFGLGSEEEEDSGAIMPPAPPPSVLDTQELALQRRSSVTGGLAGAIAALAERQFAGSDISAQQAVHTILPHNPTGVISQREEISGTNQEYYQVVNSEEEALETASPSEPFHRSHNDGSSPVFRKLQNHQMVKCSDEPEDERGNMLQTSVMVDFSNSERERECASLMRDSASLNISEARLANWVSSTTQLEYEADLASSITKWSGDQSSDQAEVGTSFSSSIPSASELPWEAPDFPPGRSGASSSAHSMEARGKSTVVPASYEEQMMLAMALSLADAQAQTR